MTEEQRSFGMSQETSLWYAIYTRPRWEKKIARLLEEKGIENYCPVAKKVKQWSDRKKIIYEPIFKSYIFVKIEDEKKWELRKINGVLNFVYWLGKPALIKDNEIKTIQKFLGEFTDVQIEKIDGSKINSLVKIRQGAFMDYRGILIELSGNIARVRIESMGIQLYANFDKRNVEPLN